MADELGVKPNDILEADDEQMGDLLRKAQCLARDRHIAVGMTWERQKLCGEKK